MKLYHIYKHFCLLCLIALVILQAADIFGADTETASVIMINSIDELQKIGRTPQYPLTGTYMLGRDIDAAAVRDARWNNNSGAGFQPIGTIAAPFNGIFDGNSRVIRGLYINRPVTDFTGLFGVVGPRGVVKNLGVVQATIKGQNNTGSLCGLNNGGSIINCYSAASETKGRYFVGALSGWNKGTIRNCYLSGSVNGINQVGGLAGFNNTGTISNSYSSGAVVGSDDTGGLTGYNDHIITNCYSTCSVRGNSQIGGLVGRCFSSTSITYCYSTGVVSGTSNVGGLIGFNNFGSITKCYWDKNTSLQADSAGGEAKTTALLMTMATFSSWDFTNTWFIIDHETRPFLRMEHGTSIRNSHQLQLMELNPTADYTLEYTIDLTTSFKNESDMWGTDIQKPGGKGFVPIGTIKNPFSGSLYGQGHILQMLHINRPGSDNVGLFAFLSGSIATTGIEAASIHGKKAAGVIAGALRGGSISNCYTAGKVEAEERVGGLVGEALRGSTILASYSTSEVIGTMMAGGLVGSCNETALTNCYWDTERSGQSAGAGTDAIIDARGKTTAEMKNKLTFTPGVWDFDKVWDIKNGQSYPFFRSANAAPAAAADRYTVVENTTLSVPAPGILGNDIDPDGDNLTATVKSAPSHGQLNLRADGSFTYVPNIHFTGTDSFSYLAKDRAIGAGGKASVTITVTPIPSPESGIADNSSSGKLSLADNSTQADGSLMPDTSCPVETLYGKESPDTETLRTYRNQVLSKTAPGRAMIRLYYHIAPILDKAIVRDEGFRQKAKKITDMLLPWIKKRLQ